MTEAPLPIDTSALGIGSTQVNTKDGMVIVYVPAGDFLMGSENGYLDEKPQHTVYLDAFWIYKTEVINAMYAKCVEAGACQSPLKESSFTRGSYYNNPSYADYTVIYVNWSQAGAYCKWTGGQRLT